MEPGRALLTPRFSELVNYWHDNSSYEFSIPAALGLRALLNGENMTGGAQELAIRLDFLGIDSEKRQFIVKSFDAIKPELPGIIARFYERVMGNPETAAIIGGPGNVGRLQKAQVSHWTSLFSAKFDADYAQRAVAIGAAHLRVGLEPRLYIAGYSFIQGEICEVLVRALRKKPDMLAKCLSAAQAAIMLDMELAISAYLTQGEEKRHRELGELADQLEATIQSSVDHVLENMNRTSEAAQYIHDHIAKVNQRASSVSDSTQETAENISRVAAATEELTVTEQEIQSQVGRCAEVARSAVAEVANASERMTGLSEASDQISKAATLISDIASQTNLLALNATIEAARAGEAGKGFAVVAAEVKALATQTTKATEEISGFVAAIQRSSGDVSTAVDGIQQTIRTVEEITDAIRISSEEQARANSEIGVNVHRSAEGTRLVSGSMREVAKEVSDVNGRTDELSQISGVLTNEIQELRRTVRTLVGKLRTHEEFDRRTAYRVECRLPADARLATGQTQPVTITNLSSDGCAVSGTDFARTGALLTLEFGASHSLSCVVLNVADGRTHLKFKGKALDIPALRSALGGKSAAA